jgi:rubrerythrin
MFENLGFPKEYEYVDVVWLYRKTDEGVCLICEEKASYIILDEEGLEFKRCFNCFQELLKFRKILLVERDFWQKKLSKKFHGLRKNPKPRENLLKKLKNNIESSKFLTCDVCGCRFASNNDLESHVEAWYKPGGVYYGRRYDVVE